MGTEQRYPELSGEDSALVPQNTPKAEWPKKIRALTATELDRLAIDAEGRFYWDSKLVNYHVRQPTGISAVDAFDRAAFEIIDRAALVRQSSPSDGTGPSSDSVKVTSGADMKLTGQSRLSALVAPASDLRKPETRQADYQPAEQPRFIAPTIRLPQKMRVTLSGSQSLGLFVVITAFLLGAAGVAAQGWVAAHDWSCRTGLIVKYCGKAPASTPAARPDFPA
jgi:hypothetical protein